MANPKPSTGLNAGGKALWLAICEEHEDLDAMQLVQLEEACRAKDRLDKIDLVLTGDVDVWASIAVDFEGTPIELRITPALAQANATANLLKQLLAALRLPDAVSGQKPQYRGPRGAHAPKVPGGADADTAKSRASQRWGA